MLRRLGGAVLLLVLLIAAIGRLRDSSAGRPQQVHLRRPLATATIWPHRSLIPVTPAGVPRGTTDDVPALK